MKARAYNDRAGKDVPATETNEPTPVPSVQLPAVSRSRYADQVYEFLFHRIVTGKFPEGQMLPTENEMCSMLSVSRPVVREALERLRSEGLVASKRGLGSFVQPRPPADRMSELGTEKLRVLEENLEFRRIIEPKSAILASQRRTKADLNAMHDAVDQYEQVAIRDGAVGVHLDFSFHLAVAKASHNRRIVEAIRAVEYDIDHGVNFVRYMVRFDHLERSRKVHAEHTRILKAIERGEANAAERAMRDHLEQARVRMANARPSAK